MSLLSRLRAAAREATETAVEFAGDDPAELVALARHIAAREGCTAECEARPAPADRPRLLSVRFARRPALPR